MTTVADPTTTSTAARWELIRALGAAILGTPSEVAPIWRALELPEPGAAELTEVFVLALPPHAAIHLGPEGQLGGEGLDRVNGFRRALGLAAAEDADHLGVLLMLYAELGGAAARTAEADRGAAVALERARAALLHEHLGSWTPGYLLAVRSLQRPATSAWADLVAQVLDEERRSTVTPGLLPLALRHAPPPLHATGGLDDALDAMISPVRSGFIVTQGDLAELARTAEVGFRRGERRFALRSMLEQDAPATLAALADHARSWAAAHRLQDRTDRDSPDPTARWWARRAETTATTIDRMLADRERSASSAVGVSGGSGR